MLLTGWPNAFKTGPLEEAAAEEEEEEELALPKPIVVLPAPWEVSKNRTNK